MAEKGCPDGGACHHLCGRGPCFRVISAEPLSAAGYPGDRWPEGITTEHRSRWLAREIAQHVDTFIGATIRGDEHGYTIGQTMSGGAMIFLQLGDEPFAVNVVPMIHQDEKGPVFSYEPRPEGYGATRD